MIRQVTCPINKVKELVLQGYPNYYELSEMGKTAAILDLVKECDAIAVYEYMQERK